jgi:hypothetical protein
MRTTDLTLDIPESAWMKTGWNDGENADRLLAQVTIMGTGHHIEAYRIEDRDDGYICLANPEMEEELMPTLQDLYSGAYETVTIRGHRYVLFMFPHAS